MQTNYQRRAMDAERRAMDAQATPAMRAAQHIRQAELAALNAMNNACWKAVAVCQNISELPPLADKDVLILLHSLQLRIERNQDAMAGPADYVLQSLEDLQFLLAESIRSNAARNKE